VDPQHPAAVPHRSTGRPTAPAYDPQHTPARTPSWRSRTASLLSTTSHEAITAVLPGLVTALTPAAPLLLALMEAFGYAAQGLGRFTGAHLGTRPHRRRLISLLGHTGIGVSCLLIAAAASVGVVFVSRVGSWAARGVRSPLRPGQAIEAAGSDRAGLAVGLERSISFAGATLGPLAAIALLAFVPIRVAIASTLLPVVAALVLALRDKPRPRNAVVAAEPLRSRLKPLTSGTIGRHFLSVSAFRLSDIAAVMLVLRASKLLNHSFGSVQLLQSVALLYAVHQVCAALAAIPAGALSDRFGPGPVVAAGSMALLVSYAGFALSPAGDVVAVAGCLIIAGGAAGAVETAQFSGVARYAPSGSLWAGIGLLSAIESGGRLIATITAGTLWTLVSPIAGLLYCVPLLALAVILSWRLRGPVLPREDVPM
jgi:MFS family permease